MSKKQNNPFGNIGSIIADSGELDSFISNADLFYVETDKIELFGQVRKEFNEQEIAEMAETMKKVGVLQNIVLNEIKNEDGTVAYHLIAGERRYRAAKLAKLSKMPARVLNVTEEQARLIQIVENIHRTNLSAIELANALDKELIELKGDKAALAKRYNKSASWLSKAMQLNKVTGAAQEAMSATSDAETILGIQTIEKTNPEKAKELVAGVKDNIGKKNTRKTVKDAVKAEKAAVKANKAKSEDKEATKHKKPAEAFPQLKEPENKAPKQGKAPTPAKTNNPEQLEQQEPIDFGDAVDLFCFEGSEVPDSLHDLMLGQSDNLTKRYENAGNLLRLYPHFLEKLQEAGFVLERENLNIQALIDLVVLVNSADTFDLERLTLNIRDTLKVVKDK